MAASKNIETGVDKLVSLIAQKKRIAVDDAAKELGVGALVVQEWAEFLEEEGIISIEYKLSKAYLVERKLTAEEAQNKAKELADEKDVMVRKIDTSISRLDYDVSGLDTLKKEFEALKKDLGGDMEKVKAQLEELSKYESFKKTIDVKLKEQEKEFQELLQKAHLQIDVESKRYQEIISSIDTQKGKLLTERKNVEETRSAEETLKQKMAAISALIESVRGKTSSEDSALEDSEKHLKKLEALADQIRKDVETKKSKELEPLMKLSHEHEQKIRQMQEEIVKKAAKTKDDIERSAAKGQEASKKFVTFFEKRVKIEGVLSEIDKEHDELKLELEKLKRKAIAFSVSAHSMNPEQMKEMERKLQEIEAKKSWFKDQLGKLTGLLKS